MNNMKTFAVWTRMTDSPLHVELAINSNMDSSD